MSQLVPGVRVRSRVLGLVSVVVFALVVAVALVVGGGGLAEAQSADRVLVSNMGQSAGATVDLSTTDVAQRFTTGGNGGGYVLSSVELSFAAGSSAAPTPTVKIVGGSADGDVEATLTAATATVRGNRNVTYTAPGGTLLAAGTDYWVVATQNGASAPLWRRLTSAGVDDTSAAGWWVNNIEERTQGTTGSFVEVADGRPGRLRVNGSLVDPVPLAVGNLGQPDGLDSSLIHNRAQGFRTGSHPAGYELAGLVLEISGLSDAADAPTVALYAGAANGTKVADFAGPSSVPSNGWLEYTPTEPLVLLGGTTYWIVVTGDADSGKWVTAANLGVDVDAAAGWAVSGRALSVIAAGVTPFSTDVAFKIGVRATPVTDSLGGNIDQIPSGDRSTTTWDLAQEFTTGRNTDDYDLDEVHLLLAVNSAPTVTLHYRSGVKVADLWSPDSYGPDEQTHVFTPAVPVTLAADTTYVVRVEGGDARWTTTASHSEDSGGHTGLAVGDKALTRVHGSSGSYSAPAEAHMLRLRGEVNPVDAAALWSNVMQDTGAAQTALSTSDIAQGFATLGGADKRIAALSSVGLRLRYTGSTAVAGPSVGLWEGDPTKPDTWVWLRDLEKSDGISSINNTGTDGQVVTYSAFVPGTARISPVTLKSSTDYFVVAQGAAAGVEIMATTSTSADGDFAGFMFFESRGAIRTSTSAGAFSDHTRAFRMSVNGFYLPQLPDQTVPATESANVFRVRGELHVNLDDFDPAVDATAVVSDDSYEWQRFSADGDSLENGNIGTGAAYRLTDADVGKTIRAVAQYTDVAGYKKGPVTSALSPVIEAAPACAAPVPSGGAVELLVSALVVSEFDGNYGFSADSSLYDRLDQRDFTASDTNDYNIEALAAYDASTNFLAIGLDGSVTTAEKRQMTLYVCDEPYAFSSSTVDNSFEGAETAYKWDDADLDWSDVGGLTVRLVQDSTPPSFEGAAVDGTSLVVTFSEDLAAAASLANSAFTVMKTPQGGTAQTVALSGTDSPSVSGKTVTLTLAAAVAATDTEVTVAYTKPDSGTANTVADLFGNETASFTSGSASASAVLAADGKTLTLSFGDTLNATSVPAASAFTVRATPAGGTAAVVALADTTPVAVSGTTVILKTDRPMAHNDTIVVNFVQPTSGFKLLNAGGMEAASADFAVANESLIPRVSIRAVYDDASPWVAPAEFEITRSLSSTSRLSIGLGYESASGSDYFSRSDENIPANKTSSVFNRTFLGGINRVNASGPVTFTVAESDDYLPALSPDDSATVEVKLAASGPTTWLEFPSLTPQVTEGETVSVPAVLRLASGAAAPRVPAETPGTSVALYTLAGTATINADYSHKTMNIHFVYAEDEENEDPPFLVDGWGPASDGGMMSAQVFEVETIQDALSEGDETFEVRTRATPGAPTGVLLPSTDAEQPTVTILDDDPFGVSGVSVTSSPASGDFYRVGETVTLAAAMSGPAVVTGSPLLNLDIGGESRQAGYVSGSGTATLVFSYTVVEGDEDHDGISWPLAPVDLNGGSIKFDHADVNERVDAAADLIDGVLTAAGAKIDADEPRFFYAEVNATSLVITFSEDLAAAASLANSAFTVMKTPEGGTAQAVTLSGSPSISGARVTLTLAEAVAATDYGVTVAYTKPDSGTANTVADTSGREAASFTAAPVYNALGDNTVPVSTSTVLAADGKTLTLSFDDRMDAASVPAASAFTVRATPAGGTEAPVALDDTTPVAVSGTTVILKTDRPMAHNDDVVVSYVQPTSGFKLQSVSRLEVASADFAVTNESLIPRISLEAVYEDASPYVARVVIKLTRSLTSGSALEFFLDVESDADYAGDQKFTGIFAGHASRVFTFEFNEDINDINVSGPLTFTVPESDALLPALAPHNSATVQVKLAASGPTAWLEFPSLNPQVAEGATVDVPVRLRLAPGAAEPREDATVALFTLADTATINKDYEHKSRNVHVLVADPETGVATDWSRASDGGWVAAKTFEVLTIQDTLVEGDETFKVGVRGTPGQSNIHFPATDDQRPTITISDDEMIANRRPVFADAAAVLSVAEGAASGTVLGTVATTDPESDPLTYSVAATRADTDSSDLDAFNRHFVLDDSTGQISVRPGASINHESRSTYEVSYQVRDNKDASGGDDTAVDDTLVLTVTVTNVNEAGFLSVSGIRLPGFTMTATLSDPDGVVAPVSWQWASAPTLAGPFTDIAGATSSTFRHTRATWDGWTRVTASYTDGESSDHTLTVYHGWDPPLVTNLLEFSDFGTELTDFDIAQRFTTGANAGGYLLSTAEIDLFGKIGRGDPYPNAKIVSGSADGALVATLTSSETGTFWGTVYALYTAPENTVLTANTDYWMVLTRNGATGPEWRVTETLQLDAVSAQGWSLNDNTEHRAHGTTGSFTEQSDNQPANFRLRGIPLANTTQVFADATATTPEQCDTQCVERLRAPQQIQGHLPEVRRQQARGVRRGHNS